MNLATMAARSSLPLTLIVLALASVPTGAAEDGGPRTYPLWETGAPGALGRDEGDIPTITVYRPGTGVDTGASVVICPGGGYGFLAMDHEGKQVAQWLNGLGVTGVVLKYRLAPRYRHPAMLQDAQRAIRLVRSHAADWKLDPGRVAILGFSAGGHLASTAGTHFDDGRPDADDPIDRLGCRPDLLILGYPVIAIDTEYTHGGSRDNLLGKSPGADLLHSLSNETQVTRRTPPTFLVHTNEDGGVVPENSLLFVMALRKAGVPVEFHLFEKGQHGLGLGNGLPEHKIAPNEAFKAWPGLCATWLKGRGFLDRPVDRPTP